MGNLYVNLSSLCIVFFSLIFQDVYKHNMFFFFFYAVGRLMGRFIYCLQMFLGPKTELFCSFADFLRSLRFIGSRKYFSGSKVGRERERDNHTVPNKFLTQTMRWARTRKASMEAKCFSVVSFTCYAWVYCCDH